MTPKWRPARNRQVCAHTVDFAPTLPRWQSIFGQSPLTQGSSVSIWRAEISSKSSTTPTMPKLRVSCPASEFSYRRVPAARQRQRKFFFAVYFSTTDSSGRRHLNLEHSKVHTLSVPSTFRAAFQSHSSTISGSLVFAFTMSPSRCAEDRQERSGGGYLLLASDGLGHLRPVRPPSVRPSILFFRSDDVRFPPSSTSHRGRCRRCPSKTRAVVACVQNGSRTSAAAAQIVRQAEPANRPPAPSPPQSCRVASPGLLLGGTPWFLPTIPE